MTEIDVPDWEHGRPFIIEVFYDGESDLAIVSARGNFGSIEELLRIEKDLKENSFPEFEMGMGAYTMRATYFQGQYGEYGRCEIEPGWELDFISAEILAEEQSKSITNNTIPTLRQEKPE